jgi:hypothetical protein
MEIALASVGTEIYGCFSPIKNISPLKYLSQGRIIFALRQEDEQGQREE